jgi:uncharacterized protein (TIGR00251 family)
VTAAGFEAQATSVGTVTFLVRVSPRARRDAIEGAAGGALRVRLAAPPVEGKANEALRRFLAERLNIPRSAVRIRSGERSRLKRVEACGVTLDRVLQLASAVPQ